MHTWIAHAFEWKGIAENLGARPKYPCFIDVEVTLTKDVLLGWQRVRENLKGVAYQPKRYRLQLDTGRIVARSRTWQYRLRWDPSPYPRLEEWKDSEDYGHVQRGIGAGRYWERTDFYRNEIEYVDSAESTPADSDDAAA
jgi:hypothetical protein